MTRKELAIRVAYEAGKILLKHYGRAEEIKVVKGERSLATESDIESATEIIRTIKEEYPQDGIITEEIGSKQEQNLKRKNDNIWVIDPLDGTKDFTCQLPLFSVAIAFCYKDEVVLSVVFNPYTNELFHAEKGKGAYLNGKKINVSKTSKLIDSLVMYDSNLHFKTSKKIGLIKKLAKNIFSLRITTR